MLERPDGPDLLETARDVLLTALLPALPAERQFAARMVANAMAIAAREMTAPRPMLDQAAASSLAQDIRAGLHDPGSPTREATASALWRYTIERCAVSTPRALTARGLTVPDPEATT